MAGDKAKIGIILEAFDRVTGPLKSVNTALDSIRRPVADIQKGFRSLSVAAGIPQFSKSIAGVGSAVSKVGSEVWALGKNIALYGGLAAAGIGAIVHSAVEAASRINDLSVATGMGVESIQTLGFAFAQSGGSVESFDSAVRMFSANLGKAFAGTGKMAGFFKKADPGFLRMLKSSKSVEDALRMVVDRIGKAKTDAGKLAIAAAAVGNEAAGPFVALAKEGPEGLKKLEGALGALSAESVKAGDDLGDSLDKLRGSFSLAKNSVILGMAPALTALSDSLSNIIGNPDLIKRLNEWGRKFGDELPGQVKRLQSVLETLWENYLRPIWNGLKWIAGDSTRLNVALGVLAAVIGGKLIIAIGGLASALFSLGVTMLTTPVGWFVAALVGLAGVAFLVIRNWDAVKDAFTKLWDSPLGKLIRFTTPIGWLMEASAELIANWEPVKAFFVDLWDTLSEMWNWLAGTWFGRANAAGLRELGKAFSWATGGAFEGSDNEPSGALVRTEKTANTIREITKEQSSAQQVGVAVDQAFARQKPSKAEITVDFRNMPAGVSVDSRASSGSSITIRKEHLGIQGATTG